MKLDLQKKYHAVSPAWESAELALGDIVSFSDKTLLYFYPKDDTPWCTVENKDFSCLKDQFSEKWITLVWVSKDPIDNHKKFIEKYDLQVDLISDPDLVLHKELWAYGEKNNYGKIVQGVIRSTFLVNKTGEVIKEWRNVRAKGHVEKILREID